MASDLDNTLSELIEGTTKQVEKISTQEVSEEKPVIDDSEQAEENNEDEGVESAESSEEEAQTEDEGVELPPELEEELKNIDPELREALMQAPPELREKQINAFKKMRAGIDRKHSEFGESKKLAETTKELFKQYGLDEKNGFDQVKNLIEFERKLKSDPKAVIKSLKDMFKVDDVSESQDEIDLDSLTDNERILYDKIKRTEESARKIQEENDNIKSTNTKKEEELFLKEIVEFKDAINEDGSLKNPYFDDLLPEMERLSSLYPNDKTPQLYNKALRLNDNLYQKSLEDIRRQEQLRLSADKQEALKKAKSVNAQSLKNKSSSANMNKSLDDLLGDIIDNS